MDRQPVLTKEQNKLLNDIFAALGMLTGKLQRIARRDRLSADDARVLIEPILRIRSLLAEMRNAVGDNMEIGNGIPAISVLENAYLSIEGAIKEKRNEQHRAA